MTDKQLISVNPKNQSHINSWDIHSKIEINAIIKHTKDAQSSWKILSLSSRLNFIKKLAYNIEAKYKQLSIIMADEMGKPIRQGMSELKKCVWLCNYYIRNASNFLSKKEIESEFYKSYVSFQPIGIVLGIMPWNFPFWQVFRFAVPSLIVGNGVLLKHASNVQGCANEIENCFKEAGFPPFIFKNLRLPSSLISGVIKNHNVSGVALTGSTKAGKEVAKISGKYLKKTVLELGGNDPYLILDDADIDIAVKACVDGRLLNAGQSCISAKRLIVTKKNVMNFTEKLIKLLNQKVVGDPFEDVDMGPLVSKTARDEVDALVKKSIRQGAILKMGGKIPKKEGSYYPITVLFDVKPGMAVFNKEVFGPVFSVIIAKNDNMAIKLANKNKFGLGSAIFTSDLENGEKIANENLQSGLCFVNEFVKSDPRLPFGGIKSSGYGRELSSYGLMEFVNIKTIVVANSST